MNCYSLGRMSLVALGLSGCVGVANPPTAGSVSPAPTPGAARVLTPAALVLNVPAASGATEPFESTGSLTLSGEGSGFTWTIDDPAVGSVDGNGVVRAVAVGQTIVRISLGATLLSTASLIVGDRGGVVRAQID